MSSINDKMKILNLMNEVTRLNKVCGIVIDENNQLRNEVHKYRENTDVRILDSVCSCHSTQH